MGKRVERWGMFEVAFDGPIKGNPFTEVNFSVEFSYEHRTVKVDGFYDGSGVFKVRFMPDVTGEWTYKTKSNAAQLDGKTGEFQCIPPSQDNHGPVRTAATYHFAYEDGTSYIPVGTTCYAWTHQTQALQEKTLETLAASPFNKIRMCIFPKHYTFNNQEPERFVFPRLNESEFDFQRFDPEFFEHLEQRILELQEMGIEADLILFHPYDHWGFKTMDAETDDFYLRYVIARLAAFRNVWWSMANEFDLMKAKTMEDWDRFFRIVQEKDPYNHLRSNHNCVGFYDHSKHWVTHCSIQHSDVHRVKEWRKTYRKPVVVDECCYEGNIHKDWGNINGQEMVHRFWLGLANGGYTGHGETYMHPEDILWWSHGGELHGTSVERIKFMREINERAPKNGLNPINRNIPARSSVGVEGEYYLLYLGLNAPARKTLDFLPEDDKFNVDIVDTWEMTITRLPQKVTKGSTIEIPAKPYMALIIQKSDE